MTAEADTFVDTGVGLSRLGSGADALHYTQIATRRVGAARQQHFRIRFYRDASSLETFVPSGNTPMQTAAALRSKQKLSHIAKNTALLYYRTNPMLIAT